MANLQVDARALASRVAANGVFTDRHGGVSAPPYDEANLAEHVGDDPAAVTENREALAGRLFTPVVWMRQVHGAEVGVVRGAHDETVDSVDVLVTAQPGIALAVLVADCVPVLLADVDAGVIGAAHVGRRGLVAAAAVRAVDAMRDLGASPDGIQAWLGPSICGRCYEVPAAMRAEVESAAPGSATATAAGRPGVDLRAGLRRQLLSAGLGTVRDVGPCTAESADHYSHRRDGVTGRFAGVIVLSDQGRRA